MKISYGSENCHSYNSIVDEDQLSGISDLSIKISETLASKEPLAKLIPSDEEELVKIVVEDSLSVKKNVNIINLSQDEVFLSKAFGKGMKIKKVGNQRYEAIRSIMGVEIDFDINLTSLSDTKVIIDANNYSHVFRNSKITISKMKMEDGAYLINIYSISFIKKSSFEKLNLATFGGAKGFIRGQVQNQIETVKKMLKEM